MNQRISKRWADFSYFYARTRFIGISTKKLAIHNKICIVFLQKTKKQIKKNYYEKITKF